MIVRFLLAPVLIATSACQWTLDEGGAAFACQGDDECPPGSVCLDSGFCGEEGALLSPCAGAALAVGAFHSCVLDPAGGGACWGWCQQGQCAVGEERFVAITAGYQHTCGRRADGEVTCWGLNTDGQATAPPGTFVEVVAGGNHTCGRHADGLVECWGLADQGRCTPPSGVAFLQLTAGQEHTCGINPDGRLTCWGRGDQGQLDAPAVPFRQISASGQHTCGVAEDGKLACWGGDGFAGAVPEGIFRHVEAGDTLNCATRQDARLVCWVAGHVSGCDDTPEDSSCTALMPEDSSLDVVALGAYHGCGFLADGQVYCWGGDPMGHGVLAVPSGLTCWRATP